MQFAIWNSMLTIVFDPNRIGPADFDGWVQERGAYFPSKWDEEHYVSVLAMSDPTTRMSASAKPRVVSAGDPMRRPEGSIGLRVS